eukprot:364054-Chlamydomonas_euryale.AAC.5
MPHCPPRCPRPARARTTRRSAAAYPCATEAIRVCAEPERRARGGAAARWHDRGGREDGRGEEPIRRCRLPADLLCSCSGCSAGRRLG